MTWKNSIFCCYSTGALLLLLTLSFELSRFSSRSLRMRAKYRRQAIYSTGLALFLCLGQSSSSPDVWQWMTLYTGEGGSGEPLAIMEEDSEDLDSLGFGDARAECHVGSWVILQGKFEEKGESVFHFRSAGCSNLNTEYERKSIRFAGDPSNYTRDALTLFGATEYGKDKQIFYTDGNVQLPKVNSMAGSGSSDWTIYEEPNYSGASYCVKFEFTDYVHFAIVLYAGKPKDVNVAEDWISSVRKGCHSKSLWTPYKY